MLKRSRTFIAKIWFFFIAYYLVTYFIGGHSQEAEKQISEGITDEFSDEQQPEHRLNPLNPIVKDGPKVPELNKEVFDKLDHIYDGDVEIKKDEEHACQPCIGGVGGLSLATESRAHFV